MEWLKDPKNQPKVAIGLSVFIVVLLFCVYWFGIRQPAPPVATTDTSVPADAGTPPDGAPPGGTPPGAMPPDGGQPGAPPDPAAQQAAAPAPAASISNKPIEAWRDDPFMPIGYKPPKGQKYKATPPIPDFPFPVLPTGLRLDEEKLVPELVQPVRRMAGILVNDRVYAIIETNGESEIVQPGDTLKDRLAVVQKIERDKVLLKTKDKKPRYILVRMAASPRTPDANATTDAGPGPGPVRPIGPRGPRRPGLTDEGDVDFN